MAEPSDLDASRTITTPVAIDSPRLDLWAEYFTSPISLSQVQAHYGAAQVIHTEPLVLKLTGNAHAVVLPFGAVVFWQCDGASIARLLDVIGKLPEMGPRSLEVRDSLTVLIGQAEDRVNFREIWLRALTLEHLKIISEVLGRSVALKHTELSVTQTLKATTPIVRALELHGDLVPSAKKIKQTVGFTLNIRAEVLTRLSLFDDPAETWQSERLARLHNLLFDHFDIKKRLGGLQEKVTFLTDMNLTLLNLLQNRTSHRLEWIVIILIVIEVIFSFIGFFTRSH